MFEASGLVQLAGNDMIPLKCLALSRILAGVGGRGGSRDSGKCQQLSALREQMQAIIARKKAYLAKPLWLNSYMSLLSQVDHWML